MKAYQDDFTLNWPEILCPGPKAPKLSAEITYFATRGRENKVNSCVPVPPSKKLEVTYSPNVIVNKTTVSYAYVPANNSVPIGKLWGLRERLVIGVRIRDSSNIWFDCLLPVTSQKVTDNGLRQNKSTAAIAYQPTTEMATTVPPPMIQNAVWKICQQSQSVPPGSASPFVLSYACARLTLLNLIELPRVTGDALRSLCAASRQILRYESHLKMRFHISTNASLSRVAPGCELLQRLTRLSNVKYQSFFEECEEAFNTEARMMGVHSRIRCELTVYCECDDAVACEVVLGPASVARLPDTSLVDEEFIATKTFASWLNSLQHGLEGFVKMCDDLQAACKNWNAAEQLFYKGVVVLVVLGVCIRHYNYCYKMNPTSYEKMVKDKAVRRTLSCLIRSKEAFPIAAEAQPAVEPSRKRPKFVEPTSDFVLLQDDSDSYADDDVAPQQSNEPNPFSPDAAEGLLSLDDWLLAELVAPNGTTPYDTEFYVDLFV